MSRRLLAPLCLSIQARCQPASSRRGTAARRPGDGALSPRWKFGVISKLLRLRKLTCGLLVSGLAALALAAAAQAATISVGADFSAPQLEPEPPPCEGVGGCALISLTATAPATSMVAPVEGFITSWRLGGASATPGFWIDVVRKEAAGSFTATATSDAVTPAGNPIETFATRLPIHAGEYVEVNVPTHSTVGSIASPTLMDLFSPEMAPGATRFPTEVNVSQEWNLAFNAEIEPAVISLSPPAVSLPPTVVVPPAAPAPLGPRCLVPKLKGKKLKAAKKLVRAADCVVGPVSAKKGVRATAGKVIGQSPKIGMVLPAHAEVSIRIG
jgi:hypothetical protein